MTDQPLTQSSEPTVREVARAAGVSVGTVSRVLNGEGTVRAPMREAVLRAVRELGYQPNAAARLLRARRTRVLGMLSTDLGQPMEVTAFRGAQAAVQERGYTLLIADAQGNHGLEMRAIESFIEQRVEGVLCSPLRSVRSVSEPLRRAGIPLVLYGQWSSKPRIPTAVVEELDACREAMTDLVQAGHRSIATCGLAREPSRHRRTVLESILRQDRGEDIVLHHIQGQSSHVVAERLREALAGETPPTAVVVLTHGVVAESLRVIQEAGLWYPEDISIIAFGDSDWALALKPPLNVIAVDYRRHTAEAAELLVRIVEGGRGTTDGPVGSSEYTRRGSVGPPGRRG